MWKHLRICIYTRDAEEEEEEQLIQVCIAVYTRHHLTFFPPGTSSLHKSHLEYSQSRSSSRCGWMHQQRRRSPPKSVIVELRLDAISSLTSITTFPDIFTRLQLYLVTLAFYPISSDNFSFGLLSHLVR